ncbi:winged helix-turn-helix transcriptional regulator [Ramlibacter sp. G-1-2-2]|uniref:Winged helix-turn-helix transcriptional regulator n=1 Tax=Ramlibacter agri TaxID=2728837 RepID=A0A848H6K4_9BURK|nr:MarR family winged helix-turn-helix transcriptional regulator [Ramlibacter agri]NML46184.1 winged helix-turn-helix transcriptional regulator [Ramlibacter agri]
MPTQQPLDKRINYRLNLIAHGWSAVVAAKMRGKYRLNAAAMKILSVIAHYQPISPSELGTRTATDSPKIARAVGTLVDQGLVERLPDPHDGRRAVLSVTPKGARIHADIDDLANTMQAKITSELTEAERKSLYAILDKLEAGVHRQLRG